jgi:hypothetical protein
MHLQFTMFTKRGAVCLSVNQLWGTWSIGWNRTGAGQALLSFPQSKQSLGMQTQALGPIHSGWPGTASHEVEVEASPVQGMCKELTYWLTGEAVPVERDLALLPHSQSILDIHTLPLLRGPCSRLTLMRQFWRPLSQDKQQSGPHPVTDVPMVFSACKLLKVVKSSSRLWKNSSFCTLVLFIGRK